MGIIYKAENIISNKVYIGKTSANLRTRKRQHIASANNNSPFYFHNALKKYGESNFIWEIIDSHEDDDVLNSLEKLHIARYMSNFRNFGYNLTTGGDGISKSVRIKLSKSKQGNRHNMYGKHHSKKSKNKIRESCIKGKEFPGTCFYRSLNILPWQKVWISRISYNGHSKSLGYFEDPLSASIVYNLVRKEL